MSDKHLVNSVEWILNQGEMSMDIPITEDVSEIEKTTIDWPVSQHPNPRLIASTILAALESKIYPNKPHSFTVHDTTDSQERCGLIAMCWYKGVGK
jgi:hypothetical protein